MNLIGNRDAGERGAVLIQTAIIMLVLFGLTTFVVDYGVLLTSRAQAQNAADAGALSGAIGRAYDDRSSSPSSTSMPYQSAQKTALCAAGSSSCPGTPLSANPIWASQSGATTTANVSWTCPAEYSGYLCAKVDVYRNGENSSTALPTFFGKILGVNSQGVKATATAIVGFANATNCMAPFALADKWVESVAPAGTFNHWTKVSGNLIELTPHDVYTAPSSTSSGSGYNLTNDLGVAQTLIAKSVNDDPSGLGAGWSLSVDLPDGNGNYPTGSSKISANISTCVGHPVHIGDYLPTENVGTGPIKSGANDLIAKDPNATWNSTTKTVQNSCAPGRNCPNVTGFVAVSPRIVPLALFDIEDFQHRSLANDTSPCPTNSACVKVVNILGFFVNAVDNGGNVTGYLMAMAGDSESGVPSVAASASFLATVRLVR
jgi:hypothetical protein